MPELPPAVTAESMIEGYLRTRKAESVADGLLTVGERLGEWRVEAYLGRGLSAEVYRVVNVRFLREGALKLLIDPSRGLRERFLAESDAIRFLHLAALPQFMGSGEHQGAPYYVMEYLRPLPDPMPRGEIPGFMNRVAKAVHALHESGYIHRDLKPGNILCRPDGSPVLIDLGLIKKRGLGVTDPIVRHGDRLSIIDGKPVGVGTLDFAAPEQLLKGEATVHSDIFSLGKILRWFYENRPPRNLRHVIRRATREQPEDRFASAAAFAAAIRHRNYPAIAMSAFGGLLLLGAVLFPVIRPYIATVVNPILNPPKKLITISQKDDESEASYLNRIRALAQKGDPKAQTALAEAYYYGRGTEIDKQAAVVWYQRAAEAGEADAQASLGLCFFRGIGCEADRGEAFRWWQKSADQGCLPAINDLAYCYLNGFGVKADSAKGFALALSAAERGHAASQTMVGECYLDGRGVEKNLERGETWLYRAARQGNKRAEQLLKSR